MQSRLPAYVSSKDKLIYDLGSAPNDMLSVDIVLQSANSCFWPLTACYMEQQSRLLNTLFLSPRPFGSPTFTRDRQHRAGGSKSV